MAQRFAVFLLTIFITGGCNWVRKAESVDDPVIEISMDTIEIAPDPERPQYQAAERRVNDLLHTKLEVSFDWDKTWLYGKATLTFKPYFYPVTTLELDAKGFEIHKVLLQKSDTVFPLKYNYDSMVLMIQLDKEYTRKDTYTVFIDYTAKPNELESSTSLVSSSDKGLYFINPDGKDPNKPKQIWTQGETESSSCWFPTIDAPNEKTTQEMYITVEDKYVTLSNGKFVYSSLGRNGTRTDIWKQDMPHAPYLFMMAVGDFAVVKDKWRDIEVNYYVEREFEPYARLIFGNTPEMLEFYSNILGVDYPWQKYSQIVVRDFVSGAMENTSATIHFGGLQSTARELLDDNNEEYISHELFHQWFGDLVTCESWANTTLNEAFATYGEYLWILHKYGRDDAESHLRQDLVRYLSESKKKQEPLIRFQFEEADDMFDRHSYQKGCRVVYMLHKYLGDEAFFEGLKLYLTNKSFQTAEIHDLRMAFEEVSGEDLNWFFNQWFLNPGHPNLIIEYDYDDSAKKITTTITQELESRTSYIYRMPVAIDVYHGEKVKRHNVVIEEASAVFTFDVESKPDLVNVDGEKMLLCEKEDNKTTEEFIHQYRYAPLYLDRQEAVGHLHSAQTRTTEAIDVLLEACNDKYWGIRRKAINALKLSDSLIAVKARPVLVNILATETKPQVKAAVIEKLAELEDETLIAGLIPWVNDSSYLVSSKALGAIFALDNEQGFQLAKAHETSKGKRVLLAIAEIYSEKGKGDEARFFEKVFTNVSGFRRYSLFGHYGNYLARQDRDTAIIRDGVNRLSQYAMNEEEWWLRYAAMNSIKDIKEKFEESKETLEGDPEKPITSPEGDITARELIILLDTHISFIESRIQRIKEKETNDNLKRIYNKS